MKKEKTKESFNVHSSTEKQSTHTHTHTVMQQMLSNEFSH